MAKERLDTWLVRLSIFLLIANGTLANQQEKSDSNILQTLRQSVAAGTALSTGCVFFKPPAYSFEYSCREGRFFGECYETDGVFSCVVDGYGLADQFGNISETPNVHQRFLIAGDELFVFDDERCVVSHYTKQFQKLPSRYEGFLPSGWLAIGETQLDAFLRPTEGFRYSATRQDDGYIVTREHEAQKFSTMTLFFDQRLLPIWYEFKRPDTGEVAKKGSFEWEVTSKSILLAKATHYEKGRPDVTVICKSITEERDEAKFDSPAAFLHSLPNGTLLAHYKGRKMVSSTYLPSSGNQKELAKDHEMLKASQAAKYLIEERKLK